MKITFVGAAHEVTGSCTLLELAGEKYPDRPRHGAGGGYLCQSGYSADSRGEMDCQCRLSDPCAYRPFGTICRCFIKTAFAAKFTLHEATCSLCQTSCCATSAHIQDIRGRSGKTRKARARGRGAEYEPLYDRGRRAGRGIVQVPPLPVRQANPWRSRIDCECALSDIGHLLGSAEHRDSGLREGGTSSARSSSAATWATRNQPITERPAAPSPMTDYVVDRVNLRRPPCTSKRPTMYMRRPDRGACSGRLTAAATWSFPSFAVGRTQEMLYLLARDQAEKALCTGTIGFPVYVDSPLANEATSVFLQCDPDLL